MTFDFSIITNLDYEKRLGNLDALAHGVVKSKKNFPFFLINDKKYVFKPLSKTKPYTTPFFAYSEVVWSTIVNKYFDESAPIYKLAICSNYNDDFKTKYHHGTLVESLEKKDFNLLNLYQIYMKYKDNSVDIENYINYCEKFYSFTNILDTDIMNNNQKLGEKLAYQILLSILRLDQNYHYENPLFYEKENQIVDIVPPIDYEFSTMFMFLDNLELNLEKYIAALDLLLLKIDSNDILGKLKYETFGIIPQNLDKIAQKYPHIVKEFLTKLQNLITDLEDTSLKLEDKGYLVPFNSYNFEIGHARYKENNESKALEVESNLQQYSVDLDIINNIIYEETLNTCKIL